MKFLLLISLVFLSSCCNCKSMEEQIVKENNRLIVPSVLGMKP